MTISLHHFHTGFGAGLYGVALSDELSSVNDAAIHAAVAKRGFLLHEEDSASGCVATGPLRDDRDRA